MSKTKSYAVIGLGSFGSSVARTLAEEGMEVMVIDSNKEKVNVIAPYVTYALQLDVTSELVLKTVGLDRMDGAIIAIGENLEASVMSTMLCKEMGIPKIIVKAENDLQKSILLKIGADEVVLLEKDSGYRLAKNIVGNFKDYFNITSDLCIVEINAKADWVGKTLKEMNFRNQYHLNIISIQSPSDENPDTFPNPDRRIKKNDILIAAGKEKDIEQL